MHICLNIGKCCPCTTFLKTTHWISGLPSQADTPATLQLRPLWRSSSRAKSCGSLCRVKII